MLKRRTRIAAIDATIKDINVEGPVQDEVEDVKESICTLGTVPSRLNQQLNQDLNDSLTNLNILVQMNGSQILLIMDTINANIQLTVTNTNLNDDGIDDQILVNVGKVMETNGQDFQGSKSDIC